MEREASSARVRTPLEKRSRCAFVIVVGALLLAAGTLGWKCAVDPDVVYLARDSRAEWITYASAPSDFARPRVGLETIFTRAFDLEHVEPGATIHVRFQRSGAVTVNGILFDFLDESDANWKKARSIDVSAALRPGRNEIVARARSSFGPPALWLAVDCGGPACRTDSSWRASLAGATDLPARLAATPMSEWSVRADGVHPTAERLSARAPDPLTGLARRALHLGGFAVVAAAIVLAGGALLRRRAPKGFPTSFLLVLVAAAAIWAPLFVHNRGLAPDLGFDYDTHGEYVQYILDRGSLPLADEGWEMFQPPLYYLVAAAVTKLGGHARVDADAVQALRWIGFLAGALQVAFVVASLKLLFPDRPSRAIAGFVIVTFLPVQLYLYQYVTNEGLAAMLVSAAVYLTLRILARDDATFRSHALLGAVLGLAMLTKFSALIAVVAVGAVLAGRHFVRGAAGPRTIFRTIGALVLACLLVCGWHFLRVAIRFGNPFITAWDPATGFAWWQDPGYRVAGDYWRFGASLVQPVYGAAHSVPDGIYSTLWADGLVGGQSALAPWPPWNYDAMSAGGLLAILPTLALLAGFVAALVRLVREPRADWFLLVALFFLTGFAIVLVTLEVPAYAHAKAFFGSAALVPLCAVAALGLDVLAARSRALRAIVLIALGCWALNAYASFWSVDGASAALPPALSADEDPRALHEKALAEASSGRAEEALETASLAVRLDSESAQAHWLLAVLRLDRGETDSGIASAREAVRLAPTDPKLHALLGEVYRTRGDLERALEHYGTAYRIQPGDTAVRNAIAEIRAEIGAR